MKDVKVTLSTLWVFVMFNYIYGERLPTVASRSSAG
jgi:hypothetical protein